MNFDLVSDYCFDDSLQEVQNLELSNNLQHSCHETVSTYECVLCLPMHIQAIMFVDSFE